MGWRLSIGIEDLFHLGVRIILILSVGDSDSAIGISNQPITMVEKRKDFTFLMMYLISRE
jgi:hypothetical protein